LPKDELGPDQILNELVSPDVPIYSVGAKYFVVLQVYQEESILIAGEGDSPFEASFRLNQVSWRFKH
jgi:hypothetical protein